MTRRTEIARSLAAALDGNRDLERCPAQEVEADLRALDVDPARSVALAKALARRPEAPPAQLLARLAEDDDAAGIEALERAPIDEVRARVPAGISAAVAAAARRQAGAATKVVGFRRRLRLIGVGGSLVGLAAGLALVLLTRGDQLSSYLFDQERPAREMRALEEQRPKRSAEAEQAAEAPAAPAEAPAAALRAERQRPAVAASAPDSVTARFRSQQEEAVTAAGRPALLIVDPNLAPDAWRSLALSDGGLDRRLADARRIAGGRRIVALAAHGVEENRREVAIVVGGATGDAVLADRSPETLPDVLGPLPDGLEVLPLD